jgi:sarcosine oxidase
MYTASDGHAEPVQATRAFHQAAVARGAEVHEQCAVEAIETAGGAVHGVVTERGRVRTPVVVCAAGAWSARLARSVGLSLPQRWVRATVARTTPAPPLTRAGVWGPALAFRQRRDGSLNLAAGGAADFDVTLDALRHVRLFVPNYWKNRRLIRFHLGRPLARDLVAALPWSAGHRHPFTHGRQLEPPPNPAKVGRSLDEIRRLFPGLDGLSIARSWAGYIDATPDALPVLGEVLSPRGFILATGFSGHGFAMGPIAGRLVAELVTAGKPSLDLHGFRFTRFAEGAMGKPRNVL